MSIYGLIIGISIIVGIELLSRKSNSLNNKDLLFVLFLSVLFSRLLFLLHNVEEVSQGLINPLAVWDGGLTIYGALIGLLLSLYILYKYKNIPFLSLSDPVLTYLPLIQALGRLGNYFNHEIYGKPTELFWSIYIPLEKRLEGYESYTNFHPAFLYELLLDIILYILLVVQNRRIKKAGIATGTYLVGYGLIRLFLNTIRIDKEYFFNLETSNLLSAIFICLGIFILVSQYKNREQ